MISIIETKDHHVIVPLSEEVQNLHAQLHPELFKPFNRASMEKALEQDAANPNCRIFVAKKNEHFIGYILCLIKEVKENAFYYSFNTLYIDQLCVLKEHQKSGAGKLLMEKAEETALKHSIHRVELDHWSRNTVAAAFFRKNGYSLCKERLCKLL